MKRLLLILVCVTAFAATAASGQKRSAEFGVRAGFNINTFWDNDYDLRVLPGFNTGAFVDIYVVKNFYIQPGFGYSRKGAIERVNGSNYKFKLDYLELPLYAGYVFDFRKVSLDVHGGIYFAYGIAGKSENIYGTHKTFKNNFDRFDIGITEGFALRFNKVSVGIMAHMGFINVLPDAPDPLRNATISFNLGVRF